MMSVFLARHHPMPRRVARLVAIWKIAYTIGWMSALLLIHNIVLMIATVLIYALPNWFNFKERMRPLSMDFSSLCVRWMALGAHDITFRYGQARMHLLNDEHELQQQLTETSAMLLGGSPRYIDPIVINAIAERVGMLCYVRYFAKTTIKYFPVIGCGMCLSGMPLVDPLWSAASMDQALCFVCDFAYPAWLVSFVNDVGSLQVLQSCLRGIGECRHIRRLLDVSIAVFDGGKPGDISLVELFTGGLTSKDIFVKVDVLAMSSLPKVTDTEACHEWLQTRLALKHQFAEAIGAAFDEGLSADAILRSLRHHPQQ